MSASFSASFHCHVFAAGVTMIPGNFQGRNENWIRRLEDCIESGYMDISQEHCRDKIVKFITRKNLTGQRWLYRYTYHYIDI